MIYHQKNKKNKKFIFFIFILFLFFILIFADSFFRKTVNNSYGKLWSIKEFVFYPINSIGDYLASKKTLISTNESLNEENKKLKIENLTTQILRNENESLKKIIQNNQEIQDKKVVAKVLQIPPFSVYDKLVVDKNNNDVKIGNNVYFGNLIVGKVEEVYSNTILVKLISTSGEKTQARINDKYDVEIEGRGNMSFVAYLPKDLNIQKGDIVSYPDSKISILGVIQEIKTTEASTFQEIYFHFPINFSEIRFVEIKI